MGGGGSLVNWRKRESHLASTAPYDCLCVVCIKLL